MKTVLMALLLVSSFTSIAQDITPLNDFSSGRARVAILKNTQSWTGTGVTLFPGDTVGILVRGIAAPNGLTVPSTIRWVGPEGWGGGAGGPVSTAAYYSVIGKIGSSDAPFYIGSIAHFISHVSGQLFLGTNDCDPSDNAGFYIAHIYLDNRPIKEFTNVAVSVLEDWNMISNPVTSPVPDDSARHLYPTLSSQVFRFDNAYVPGDVMVNRVGYWGKFPAATTHSIVGTPLTCDSLNVLAGWNMVGSISNAVDTATIVQIPAGLKSSSWFDFNNGYSPTSPLVPGKAYWIRVNFAGKFVLIAPSLEDLSKVQRPGASPLDGLNTLTIQDGKGGTQTLYFGADAGKSIPESQYAMPPLPPAGAFDARFETADGGSMVQVHSANVSGAEFPVAIRSDAYPITISWKVKNASYELTDGVGGRVFPSKSMYGEGTTKIASSNVTRFSVKLVGDGTLPKEFALAQNYPNPFNPSTTIKYDLPKDSRVSLKVFNILGQEVATLVNEDQEAGYKSVEWNASDVASGVYFYRLDAGSYTSVKKLLLLK